MKKNNIEEKTNRQRESPNVVLLFKEGAFYKAYNEGVFLFREKGHNITVKYNKIVDDFVLSIRFSERVFQELKSKHIVVEKQGIFIVTLPVVLQNTDISYLDWRESLILKQLNNDNNKINKENVTLFEIIKSYPFVNMKLRGLFGGFRKHKKS